MHLKITRQFIGIPAPRWKEPSLTRRTHYIWRTHRRPRSLAIILRNEKRNRYFDELLTSDGSDSLWNRPVQRRASPPVFMKKRVRLLLAGISLIVLGIVVEALISKTKWRYLPPLPSPCAFYVTKTMPDGRILFGYPLIDPDPKDPGEQLEPKPGRHPIFDPKADSWSQTVLQYPDLPHIPKWIPRDSAWRLVTEGRGLFMSGGVVGLGVPTLSITTDALYVPEPAELTDGRLFYFRRSYEFLNPKTNDRDFMPSVSDGGTVLNAVRLSGDRFFFGRLRSLPFPNCAIEEIIDTTAKSSVLIEDPLVAIGQTATLLPSGKILLIGGARINPTPFYRRMLDDVVQWFSPSSVPIENTEYYIVPTCRLYDPATNTFRITQPLNTARAFHTANLLPDGRILVTGGYVLAKDYGPSFTPNDDALTNTCEIISLKDIDP